MSKPRVALGLVFVLAGVVAGSSSAAKPPPFRFTDASLTLTCGELAQGKQLEVSNATPSPQALSIAVIPVSPGLAVAGSCGGITASAPPQVKPGDTVLVTLSAASATPVSTSTPGLIVARAAAGEAAVLPLTITPVQTGIAAPLLSSYSVDEYRDGDRTVISIPVDLGTSHETSLPQTRAVAMLSSNDGHVAPVTYLGIGQAGKTTVARFSIPNVVAGTYKGTVDFTPDVAGGGVDVTLTVRDHWILAVLVLLLGILVAFGSQRLFGVTLPRRTLKAKVGAIAEDAPRRHGEEKAAAGGDWRGSTLIGVHDAVNALKADVDSKTQGSWISLDDKVVAALTAKTEALAKSVAEFGLLKGKCRSLKQALDAFRDHAPHHLPDLGERAEQPRLVLRAHRQLRKRRIPVDQLQETFGAIDGAQADVVAVGQLREWVGALWAEADELGGRVAEEDQANLEQVRREIASAWRQVWRARKTDRFSDLTTRLSSAEYRLGLLWPLPAARGADRVEELRTPEGLTIQRFRGPARLTAGYGLNVLQGAGATPLAQVIELLVRPTESQRLTADVADARRDLAVARGLSWATVGVGVFLAVIAAITTLYVGKPWGSAWDYLVMATWGLATPAALAAVGAALNGIGSLDVLKRRLS